MTKLSDRIKQLRKSAGMTQEQFGKTFGMVKSTVSLYESGKSTPNDEIKQKICEYFDISFDYLLGRTDNKDTAYMTLTKASSSGQSISHWISKSGLKYEDIANKIGTSVKQLQDYANGFLLPPLHILVALSEICDVSTDCLLGISDESRKKGIDNILPFRYDPKISERIHSLCKKNNIKTSFLCDLLCLSEDEIYFLIEYGFVPHIDTIIKLADFFNVSCDYLLCHINEREEKILNTFRLLNDDNQDIIVGEIKKSLRDQKHEESFATDNVLKKHLGSNVFKTL